MPLGTSLIAAAATSAVTSVVDKTVNSVATSGMDALRSTLKTLANASDGSLVGVTQSARVEPMCLIDGELNGHPQLPDILQVKQSVFAAYYLRAFAMTTNVGGISVAGRLDPLSTSRSPMNSFIVSNEDYNERLPMYDGSDKISYGLESSTSTSSGDKSSTVADTTGIKVPQV